MKLTLITALLSLYLPLLPAAKVAPAADPRAADAAHVPAADVKRAAASVTESEAQHTTADSTEGKMNAAKLPDAVKALLRDFISPDPSHDEWFFANLKKDSQKQLGFVVDENDDPMFIIRVIDPTSNAKYQVTTVSVPQFFKDDHVKLLAENRHLMSPQIRFVIAQADNPGAYKESSIARKILSPAELNRFRILKFVPFHVGRYIDELYVQKKRHYPQCQLLQQAAGAVLSGDQSYIPRDVQNIIFGYNYPPAPQWGCTAQETQEMQRTIIHEHTGPNGLVFEGYTPTAEPFNNDILKDVVARVGSKFHACGFPTEMILSDDHALAHYKSAVAVSNNSDVSAGCCTVS